MLGKEVIGDIKLLPKEPPILNMPHLVMDIIFSSLSIEDRLNCRFVTPSWGFDHLPIRKIFKGSTLEIFWDSIKPHFQLNYEKEGITFLIDIRSTNLQPMIASSFLDNVNALEVRFLSGRVSRFWQEHEKYDPVMQTILENCQKATRLIFMDPYDPSSVTNQTWEAMRTFIANNGGHLAELDICMKFPQQDSPFNLESLHIANCNRLQKLGLSFRDYNMLEGFHHLPRSLGNLNLRGHGFTNSQLLLLAHQYHPRLKIAQFFAKHSHDIETKDPEEVNEATIIEMISILPSLQALYLLLERKREEEEEILEFCSKGTYLVSSLKDKLGEGVWNVYLEDHSGAEKLCMEKFPKDMDI